MNTSNPPKVKINLAPNCSELIDMYPHRSQRWVISAYRLARKEFPYKIGKVSPYSVNDEQYLFIIKELGMPKDYQTEDLPFLNGKEVA